MSATIVESLENLLKEEKWTRTTINNYTIKNFEDLNDLINQIKAENITSEVVNKTDEYLKNNKNSIIALYLNSILQFDTGNFDDSYILSLIKIFVDNLKWNIVEYLCKKGLLYSENKYILRILIDSCSNTNKKDELPDLWERLIRVDFEEADIVVKLATFKEEAKELDEAKSLYKKALNRYILNKNFTQVEELWKKLLSYEDTGYEYFLNIDKKISKHFSDERSIELLKYLYEIYMGKDEYDICLKVLKIILEKAPTDDFGRKEIVNIYRKKYKEHTYLEEYIKRSNLEGSWRNINDAIFNFEKHIVFDKGNFVYHRTWGIGRIVDVNRDIFTIDFTKKKGHQMSLNMALESLRILPKNHIWILKMKDSDRLKQKIKEDISWGLKVLINSYDNKATMKNFKEELVPDILKLSEWNTWWNNAKKILKTDPKFGAIDELKDTYEMRDKPLSFEEKTYNTFKAMKDFTQRFSLIIDFIENAEPDSEYLEDMSQYFLTFLNTTNNVTEQTICSYLLIAKLQQQFKFLNINLNYTFRDYFNNVEDPISIYENIAFSDYKKDYLLNIKKSYSKWDEIFLNIFYKYPNKFIFDELLVKDKSYFEKILKEITSVYKEYREAFFWIIVNVLTEEKIKEYQVDFDSILFSLIHLIELTAKDINNKKDVTKNKKISNQIKDFLFKNEFLIKYIEKSSKDFCKRLYTIIIELYVLEGDYIAAVRNSISQKYPDISTEDESLKFEDNKSKNSIMDKLLTTETSFIKVQKEIQQIKDVEIPENSKEIGWAMEKGDLKENAEFKAAKEKQAFLQNKVTKLMNDLSRANIVRKEDITNDFVTFGTIVDLTDTINKVNSKLTIMGPWESDTEKNIISYQSPFGSKFLDKKVNEEVKFKLNEKDHSYIVKKITVAKF